MMFRGLFKSAALLTALLSVELQADEDFTPAVCSVEKEQELIQSYIEKQPNNRRPGLYKDLLSAVNEYKEGRLKIVDTRPKNEFEEFRIPGSINLPLSLIEHKSFLKNKPLLVVTNGKRYRHLEKQIKRLRDAGLEKVYILDGGIHRWAAKTRYIDGKYTSKSYQTLSVKDFVSESNFGPWLVVNLSKTAEFTEPVNGQVKKLTLDDSFLLNFSSVLRGATEPMTRVLFVSNDKEYFRELSEKLSNLDYSNIYVLRETIDYIPVYKKESLIAFQKRNKSSLVECLVE